MKTDPTPNVTGAAGTPLSYGTIQSKRHRQAVNSVHAKSTTAISDTLETSDREPEGKTNQALPGVPSSDVIKPTASGGRLDVTG